MQSPARALVVKSTASIDDPERAQLAVTVASTGLSSGFTPHLFLANEGVRLALPNVPEQLDQQLALHAVPDAPPPTIALLVSALFEAAAAGSAQIVVCTPCASRRGLAPEVFAQPTTMGGAAMFLELAAQQGAVSLVY